MNPAGRHADRGSPGINLGLIITPMLDMSFQILAFFIMTYHPSALEGSLTGDLLPPAVAFHGKNPDKLFENVMTGVDVSEESLQVIVKAVPKGGLDGRRVDGEPAEIFLKAPEDAGPRFVAGADEAIAESLARLKTQLKRSAAVAMVKANIRLECQGDLKQRYVMQLYDVCKDAGYQNVAFVAPKDQR